MRLTVITPVGPGHADYVGSCNRSVREAWSFARGPFDAIRHQAWNDLRGELGRSRARNAAVGANPDADWFFFIDADDLAALECFDRFGAALRRDPEAVAVFGAIRIRTGKSKPAVIDDNIYPLDWDGLMRHGAAGTLAMGCFVRADVARATPFNEGMDVGEDFDFYLRALDGRRWVKLREPLVTICRDVPSAGGPRGYGAGIDWRGACNKVVDEWKCLTPR